MRSVVAMIAEQLVVSKASDVQAKRRKQKRDDEFKATEQDWGGMKATNNVCRLHM
jgi:hypothetical protein